MSMQLAWEYTDEKKTTRQYTVSETETSTPLGGFTVTQEEIDSVDGDDVVKRKLADLLRVIKP